MWKEERVNDIQQKNVSNSYRRSELSQTMLLELLFFPICS